MKLRDRVLVGFCVSLVLVTVLFVVDQQTETARRLAAVGGGGSGGGGAGPSSGVGMHGRSDRSRAAEDARSAWDPAGSTLTPPPRQKPADRRRPGAPQPGYRAPLDEHQPVVPDPHADDRFDDLAERVSRPDSPAHRGHVADWTAVRDVIVDDTYADGTTSNEYLAEYVEDGTE